VTRGNSIKAREILDKGAEAIDRELKDQPRTRARLLTTMGKTFAGLSLVDRANELFQSSLRANADAFGTESVEYAGVLVELAMNRSSQGAAREAAMLARQASSILEKALPPDDALRLKATYILGSSLRAAGDVDEGKRILEAGLKVIEASRTPDDRLRIWFLNDLGVVEIGAGRLDSSQRLFAQAVEASERVYPDTLHPETLSALNNLAYNFMLQGDTARARPLLERLARDAERVLGENHGDTANALQGLAEVDRREGRLDEARALCEKSLAISERVGLRRSPSAVGALLTLAQVEEAGGHLPAAEALLREGIDIVTGSLGYDNPSQLEPTDALARVLRRTGRNIEADAVDSRAAEIRRKSGQAAGVLVGAGTPRSRIDKTESGTGRTPEPLRVP
jgi:tetratricopeptide (TPR) repeat protein